MSTTLNAVVMLAGTLAVFGLLAALVQAVRSRRLDLPLFGKGQPAAGKRLLIEEVCAIDPRRRLLLIRCDSQHVLLLTGGPADMVVSLAAAGGQA